MKIRMAVKLTTLGALIVAVGYWLRGHDILTGVVLLLLAVLVFAKVVAAIISRPRRERPPRDGDQGGLPGAPAPRPPKARPPVLAASAALPQD